MAELKWTVFYGVRDGGNQRPVNGWKKGEIKVLKKESTTELKKNEPWVLEPSGSAFKTCEPQECKFVTVVAESAEEASLVVDKFLGGVGYPFNKTTGEEIGVKGPAIKGNTVNDGGKWVAALSSNLEEVQVN